MDDIHFEKPNLDNFKNAEPNPDIINNVINKIMADYNKDLSEAVATLDIHILKAVVEKWHKRGFFHDCFSLPSDEVLEITIRKMAVNMVNIPQEVQETAKEWLLSRGYDLKLEQEAKYEKINNNLYQYNSTKDGYRRVSSSYDFMSRRSEVLAHEVYVHMFEYDEYTYQGDLGGFYTYSTSAFSTMVKFQGGYLTYLRYTLNSPLSTFEIFDSFETTIEIPKSYYYQS